MFFMLSQAWDKEKSPHEESNKPKKHILTCLTQILSLITTLICAMFFAVDSCKCSKCLLWCNQSAAEEECGKERPNG